MTIKATQPRNLAHPGEILLEEFLKPMGITQKRLAKHIGVEPNVVNELVNGKRGITAYSAMKLGAALSTGPEFWLNLQSRYDLSLEEPAKGISPIRGAA